MKLRQKFTEIVDQHYDGLWTYVSFLTAGSGDTEDLVHQAFLIGFDRLAEGREFEGDPGKWLRGTARNLVHVWWRQRRKAPQGLAEGLKLLADEGGDSLELATKAETTAALEHCLGELPAGDQELIRQRYEGGDRIVRMAEQMAMKVTSLRVRFHRIRQALKLCIEAQLTGGSVT